MALKPCRECSKRVSTEAITCPNCGIPYPTNKFKEKKLKSDYGYARCEKNFCENKFRLLKVQKKLKSKERNPSIGYKTKSGNILPEGTKKVWPFAYNGTWYQKTK